MSQENPRIGKVLRVPIEIVLEDEQKIDEAIQKLSDAQKQGLGDIREEEDRIDDVLEKLSEAQKKGLVDQTKTEFDLDEVMKKLTKGQKEQLGGGAADEAEKVAQANKILSQTKLGGLVTLSKEHIGNLTNFAKAPDVMLIRIFLRKFARGAGAILLAFVIMEAIKFGIEYLTRDGMPLDRRFKRIINAEVAAFLSRMFKAQLRQGFRTLIATTIGGLRGGRGQIGGNIYSIVDRSISSKIPPDYYGREISAWEAKGSMPSPGLPQPWRNR